MINAIKNIMAKIKTCDKCGAKNFNLFRERDNIYRVYCCNCHIRNKNLNMDEITISKEGESSQ